MRNFEHEYKSTSHFHPLDHTIQPTILNEYDNKILASDTYPHTNSHLKKNINADVVLSKI